MGNTPKLGGTKMSSEREDNESVEEETKKAVIDRVIRREAVEVADFKASLDKLNKAIAELTAVIDAATTDLTAVLSEEYISTEPVDLKPYGKGAMLVSNEVFEPVANAGIVVLPTTEEEVAEVVRIANTYKIPITQLAKNAKREKYTTSIREGTIIMDLRLMGKKITKPSNIPPVIHRFIVERWAENLKPLKQKFVEAGLVGASFTEKSPDSPRERLNYYFDQDGVLQFNFESDEDTGETLMTYKDYETGFRALADKNFDSMKAFLDGDFKIEPSPETALKMAHLMPDMIEAYIKALNDAEKKFKVQLPKY